VVKAALWLADSTDVQELVAVVMVPDSTVLQTKL
jgi:hypothetical protein